MTINEKVFYVVFMVNCFQSFEDPMVRKQAMKYPPPPPPSLPPLLPSGARKFITVIIRLVSYPLWFNLSAGRLTQELKSLPKLKRHFEVLKKKEAEGHVLSKQEQYERTFLPSLVKNFFEILDSIAASEGSVNPKNILYPRNPLVGKG